ncbi:MAG: proline dehydrogenase family protein [Thermoleophilaceae bacterium]
MSTTRDLELEIHGVGRAIAEAMPSRARHPLRALDAKAMELSAQDQALKAALFRLVDVTPACRSFEDLAFHLTGFLAEVNERPAPIEAAMRVAHTHAGRAVLGAAASRGVRHMAHRFIVGETPGEALPTFERLWRDGVASSVDLLGEATITRAEADRYAERCATALSALTAAGAGWPVRETLERDVHGSLPRANLSVKVSALTPLMRADAPHLGAEDAAGRLRPLLRQARDSGAHLHVDMESLDTLEATLDLVFALLGEEEFRAGPSAGVVLQAYLREAPALCERILGWAEAGRRETPLTVRIVKGAYWDHELVEARQKGWASPVWEDKAECDRTFEALTRRLLDAREHVRVAVASHNVRSVAHAVVCNREAGGEDRDLELQVLRGLGDELQHALAALGFRVRAYCPVGDLVAGMAYLVRRLLENTANDSFLSAQQSGAELDQLLAAP